VQSLQFRDRRGKAALDRSGRTTGTSDPIEQILLSANKAKDCYSPPAPLAADDRRGRGWVIDSALYAYSILLWQSRHKARPGVGAAESVGKSTATDGPRQYTVERGDTLSYLALRHYGDPFKWEKIYEANKETMNNPHYIYVGQRIVIPS